MAISLSLFNFKVFSRYLTFWKPVFSFVKLFVYFCYCLFYTLASSYLDWTLLKFLPFLFIRLSKKLKQKQNTSLPVFLNFIAATVIISVFIQFLPFVFLYPKVIAVQSTESLLSLGQSPNLYIVFSVPPHADKNKKLFIQSE